MNILNTLLFLVFFILSANSALADKKPCLHDCGGKVVDCSVPCNHAPKPSPNANASNVKSKNHDGVNGQEILLPPSK